MLRPPGVKGLKHMKDITDKLAAIGAPISEEDQVVTQNHGNQDLLLTGMLQSTGALIGDTTLKLSIDGKKMVICFLLALLHLEWAKLQHVISPVSTHSLLTWSCASGEAFKLTRRLQLVCSTIFLTVRQGLTERMYPFSVLTKAILSCIN